jgi:hypothetical protein
MALERTFREPLKPMCRPISFSERPSGGTPSGLKVLRNADNARSITGPFGVVSSFGEGSQRDVGTNGEA